MPAGVPLLAVDVDTELARRQQGYGRGRRMQIEQDAVEFVSGVRAGETLGSPIAMLIRNRDWANWAEIMDPAPRPGEAQGAAAGGRTTRARAVTRPRPGHADLTGVLKYDRDDARDILERASARETTARVAAGAVCRRLLREFGVRCRLAASMRRGPRSSRATSTRRPINRRSARWTPTPSRA
jgi:chorismate synthase